MRLCRFGDNRLGLVDGRSVRDVTAALDVLPKAQYPFPRHDALIAHLDAVKTRVAALAPALTIETATVSRMLDAASGPPVIQRGISV